MPDAGGTGQRGSVAEVARLFTKLGIVGFGGPAAHIALMRAEVVQKRGWMEDGEFLELVGAVNLIPGPNSTELAIHLGHRRAGWRGLVVAGLCFITPAVVIVGILAWLYERHGTDPAVFDLRYAVLPVVIAVVAHALHGLGRSTLRDAGAWLVAAGAFAAWLVGVHELVILPAAALATVAWSSRHRLRPDRAAVMLAPLAAVAARRAAESRWRLFTVFLEIGSVLYGSGYVLLAFLQSNLVDRLGWLTEGQILDAVTVGQITPGPVFTTATFVGWQIGGAVGAAVATVGIFAPSFVFVAVLGRVVAWMRARPVARAALAGLSTGSLGLMAGVLVDLGRTAVVDVPTGAVAALSLALLLRGRTGATTLIVAGAAVGALRALIG